MNALEQQVLTDLVERVARLEARLDGELDVAVTFEDDDLADLDPGERAQVLAARKRLAAEDGEGIDQGLDRGKAPIAYETEGGTVIRFPTPTEEHRELRERFAADILKLEPNLVSAYARGGPLWLYAYDREFVDALPVATKRVMVEDADRDSHEEAYDMARDIFKVKQATGPELTMEALLGD